MHLLAESGGTKTAWFLYDAHGMQHALLGAGLNLNVTTPELLSQQLQHDLREIDREAISHLNFYGAGLGSPSTEATMKSILQQALPAAEISLFSDMVAAARATAANEPAIVCILGTGSNCGYWDGQAITATLGSHGYLFTDEGSGADLGRTLIGAALNGELPHDVEHLLRHWAGKPFLEIRAEIYQAPKVNVALAHYARFLSENLDNPAVRTMVISRFMAFFGRTLLRMRDHQQLPLHFVGTISAVFEAPLREALGFLQLKPGKVMAAPGEALLQYHIQLLQ